MNRQKSFVSTASTSITWIGSRKYEHKFKGYEKRIADPEYAEKWSKMIPEKEQRMYQFAKSQVSYQ